MVFFCWYNINEGHRKYDFIPFNFVVESAFKSLSLEATKTSIDDETIKNSRFPDDVATIIDNLREVQVTYIVNYGFIEAAEKITKTLNIQK